VVYIVKLYKMKVLKCALISLSMLYFPPEKTCTAPEKVIHNVPCK